MCPNFTQVDYDSNIFSIDFWNICSLLATTKLPTNFFNERILNNLVLFELKY